MTGAVMFLGDGFALAAADSTSSGPVRTLVWMIDLRDADGHGVRSELKRAAHAALEATRLRAGIRHLIVAYAAEPALTAKLRRHASTVAARLHAECAQRTGRDIDVVLLDVTGLDDAELLRTRLEQLSAQPTALAGGAALDWEDIRDESIKRAASRDYI